ncbi:MAG TPA: DNA-directed RNA polymerase subunit omega [Proteobacteria bacterium]|nr:DNA-directed RNA polymerase subunit omega [Pseudomonadota bacterium]
MFALTTESCLKKIDNVYSLVYLAAKRTVSLNRGEKSLLPDMEGEKPIMVAIEEIAAGKIALALPEEDHEPDES